MAEALTIPADKAGPVELELRDAIKKRPDCKYEDVIVGCCRNAEKRGKTSADELRRVYVRGLSNIIDLLKAYDKCKEQYIKQNHGKKIKIELQNGKEIELDPVKDFGRVRQLPVLKQLVQKMEQLVAGDDAIPATFAKYAISDEDRKYIRLLCWNDRVMVWGTREFEPSQKFAVQLWQNIETINSGDAYGEPDEQCPYCTHSRSHWNNHSTGPDYEQYWYLLIPEGAVCAEGDLTNPGVVKVYNAMKGLGPKLLVCQNDSTNDWCDRDDNPISENGDDIHDIDPDEYVFGPNGANYLDDVVNLHDDYFYNYSDGDAAKKIPDRYPWETQYQYRQRREAANEKNTNCIAFVKDVESNADADKASTAEFDVDADVWRQTLHLDESHFKEGVLKIRVPKKVANAVYIENAEINSAEGLPQEFYGQTQIDFSKCRIKSLRGWNMQQSVKNVKFYDCEIDPGGLSDAFAGADIKKIEITGSRTAGTTDLQFMRGLGKIKRIESLEIRSKELRSFDGLRDAAESVSNVLFGSSTDIKKYCVQSFSGMPSAVDSLTVYCKLQASAQDMAKNLPTAKTSLGLYMILAGENETRREIFRTAYGKVEEGGNLYYDDNIFYQDCSDRKDICLDKLLDGVPSIFDGLVRKKLGIVRINTLMTPKDIFAESLFLSGQCFGEDGTFRLSRFPLFKYADRMFEITFQNSKSYTKRYILYAMFEGGRLQVFSMNERRMVDPPFTKELLGFDYDEISFYMPKASHAAPDTLSRLSDFLLARETIRRVFPEAKSVRLDVSNMTAFENVVYPDIAFWLVNSKNLTKVSGCRLRGLRLEQCSPVIENCQIDGFSLTEPDNKVTVRNCKLNISGGFNTFRQIERCEIKIVNESKSYYPDLLKTEEGIFGCDIDLTGYVNISSPVIKGCGIRGTELLKFIDVGRIEGTTVETREVDFEMDSPTQLLNSKIKCRNIDVQTLDSIYQPSSSSEQKICDFMSRLMSSLVGKFQRILLSSNFKLDSLRFLDDMAAGAEINELIYQGNPLRIKNFRFKLPKPGQVKVIAFGAVGCDEANRETSLAGFDASAALGLEYNYNYSGKNHRIVDEYIEYFDSKNRVECNYGNCSGRMPKPEYVDQNGQFAPPKNLSESAEMHEWLRICKLMFD